MTNAQRVLCNAAAMYARVGITMILSLFTSRYILEALGVVDFGLYSVIAGIMGFMAFLNGAMATSSQRHLTHELGRGDLIQVNRIFKTCFVLHACLALLLVILGETIGLWFLSHVLNIPEARQAAAFWIYQFTICSTACYVISVPYQALLTAHEAMAAVSVLGIIQTILSFFLALLLTSVPGDKLIMYVLFSSAIAISMTLLQVALCRRRYSESKILTGNKTTRQLTGELLGFSGWSLFGSLSVVGRLQGVAFLLNIFFGPIVNAAFGIANQVSGMMNSLTQTMLQAISPRLVKQEGAGNRERMLELSLLTSKYGFLLSCFWAIPLFAEIDTVLKLWLKHPPEHAASFCRIVLLMFACDQLSSGFGVAVAAVGKIAPYQMIVGSIQLTTIPLGYLFLKMGHDPNAVLLCALGAMIVASATRGIVVQRLTAFKYGNWVRGVVMRGVSSVLPALLYALLIFHIFSPTTGRAIVLSTTTGLVTAIGAVLIGMDKTERRKILNMLFTRRQKIAQIDQ